MEEKTIKKGDIMRAILELSMDSNDDISMLFKGAPMMTLLMPIIGRKLEDRIFKEEIETVTVTEEKEELN